ncbi:Uncharacterised protein [Pragia fontium]|uniref:hypothetical protein n=1 Tax=Pragia fontium TaxID=82985 RepID=UPI00064A1059|nr:hypothetical protein [Pragia fontium]AKJ43054.1 hypothetical protein QQ39_14075 [Pragia fontium]SUB83487.1 Uncharacterised protein [Pragia fontium]
MKNKLRKIQVDDISFFWRVLWDQDAANGDFLFLRVWIAGHKVKPWITVHYQYHNPWFFYGEIITTPESERQSHFQLNALMPKQVAGIIRSAMTWLAEEYADSLKIENVHFHVDREGQLHRGLSKHA